jgi:hypothetical protein
MMMMMMMMIIIIIIIIGERSINRIYGCRVDGFGAH